MTDVWELIRKYIVKNEYLAGNVSRENAARILNV